MFNKFVLFILFFILQILLINSSSEDPVYYPNVWNPVSLYDYVSRTYLNPSNPSLYSNIQHMVVDPEKYLQYADLREAYQFMHLLYEKYNISSHVFFISHMESKYKLDEEIASFVSQLSYLLYRNYEIYDEKMTLTAVFFIKDRKMRIRTSKDLREILTDYDCLNILNRRKNDLIKNNYQQVVNGLMRDIFDFYEYNLENKSSGSNHILLYTIMLIVIIMIIFVLYNNHKEKTSKQEDKVKVFLDKLKNRKNPKEVFTESCIICLGDFLSNEKIKEIENSGDKEAFEKEETSVLECGHKFHRKCIADWLKKEPNCPMCRMKFNIKGNDNNSNKQNTGININFEHILSEILRIQSNTNLLNNREINRIRNVYIPRHNYSTSLFQNFSSYFPNNSFSSSSYSSSSFNKKSYSSHNKSYSSYNKDSGGSTSGW